MDEGYKTYFLLSISAYGCCRKIIFQENLANHSDVRFAADYSEQNMMKKDHKGFDLCVMASSDHTVITYGTFSVWGALLSRGDVIAAKGTDKNNYSSVRT